MSVDPSPALDSEDNDDDEYFATLPDPILNPHSSFSSFSPLTSSSIDLTLSRTKLK